MNRLLFLSLFAACAAPMLPAAGTAVGSGASAWLTATVAADVTASLGAALGALAIHEAVEMHLEDAPVDVDDRSFEEMATFLWRARVDLRKSVITTLLHDHPGVRASDVVTPTTGESCDDHFSACVTASDSVPGVAGKQAAIFCVPCYETCQTEGAWPTSVPLPPIPGNVHGPEFDCQYWGW